MVLRICLSAFVALQPNSGNVSDATLGPWNGTNGGAILYVTYSRCTGTFSSALRLVSRIRSPVRFSDSETCLSSQPSVSGRRLTAWAAESSVLPDVAAMNLNIISRARVHVRLAG